MGSCSSMESPQIVGNKLKEEGKIKKSAAAAASSFMADPYFNMMCSTARVKFMTERGK